VITAVVLEGRPAAQVAAEYGVSKSWLYELLTRYRDEGEAAFEPRSKRPHRSPTATAQATVELVVQLRKTLIEAPATAYQARPKAAPSITRAGEHHDRVLTDRIDNDGKLTLRVNGRLHHIGIGRTHARTPVLKLVQDLNVRIIDAATGELLRELTIDPNKDYQPTGKPTGPAPKTKKTEP
jgi:hypothetical protein